MILVTGGTGFVGRALVRQLADMRQPVRILIRPSRRTPNIPRGMAVEAAVTSLGDERGLRAAMVGVDTVYHLASSEGRGRRGNLLESDIQATKAVAQAAAESGVQRLFYTSHLGADRASAYPVLQAKAIAEGHIRRSGVNYTILRSAIVYGPGDRFTTNLARVLAMSPFFIFMPGDGKSLVQPIWVEDLATCLVWALEDKDTLNRTVEVGGPEQLTFRQVLDLVMSASGITRRIVPARPPYLRRLSKTLELMLPGMPVTEYWLDYLAANHICALDSAPRVFNLLPSRMSQRLAYLGDRGWRRGLLRTLFMGEPLPAQKRGR
jgi:uncharacterized protein YbjT (DUF2867 family)